MFASRADTRGGRGAFPRRGFDPPRPLPRGPERRRDRARRGRASDASTARRENPRRPRRRSRRWRPRCARRAPVSLGSRGRLGGRRPSRSLGPSGRGCLPPPRPPRAAAAAASTAALPWAPAFGSARRFASGRRGGQRAAPGAPRAEGRGPCEGPEIAPPFPYLSHHPLPSASSFYFFGFSVSRARVSRFAFRSVF